VLRLVFPGRCRIAAEGLKASLASSEDLICIPGDAGMNPVQISLPGMTPEPQHPTAPDIISPAITAFLNHCRVSRRLSPHTLRAYESDLSGLVEHVGGGTSTGDINRDTIRTYVGKLLEGRSLKASSARRHIATLRVFWRWLEKEGIVAPTVLPRFDFYIRVSHQLPRALGTDEMRLLVAAAEDELVNPGRPYDFDVHTTYFAIVLLFTTGVRVGELVSLRAEDISLTDSAIRVHGKGNRERMVFLPGAKANTALASYLNARAKLHTCSRELLVTPAGKPLTPHAIRKRLRRLAQTARIGRRVTPHMLRHTAATQLLEAGVDIRLVQRVLGHASITTTQIYTHVSDALLKTKLTEADTLARISGGR
jgi:site-specific recombinase XerD